MQFLVLQLHQRNSPEGHALNSLKVTAAKSKQGQRHLVPPYRTTAAVLLPLGSAGELVHLPLVWHYLYSPLTITTIWPAYFII